MKNEKQENRDGERIYGENIFPEDHYGIRITSMYINGGEINATSGDTWTEYVQPLPESFNNKIKQAE